MHFINLPAKFQIVKFSKTTGELALLFVRCSILFSIIAIYNGYPLVHSDTNSYIGSAQHFTPHFVRAAFAYSLLMYPVIVSKTMWLGILPQIIITATAIIYFLYFFSGARF